MRALVLALGALTLTACGILEPAEIADCEQYIRGKLRSPSTYERVTAGSMFKNVGKLAQSWVIVEYDAANAYGTPIRDTQICKYPMKNGYADTSTQIDHDAELVRGIEADDLSALNDTSVLNNATAPNDVSVIDDVSVPDNDAAAAAAAAELSFREVEEIVARYPVNNAVAAGNPEELGSSDAGEAAVGNDNEIDGQRVTQKGDNWVDAKGNLMAPRGD